MVGLVITYKADEKSMHCAGEVFELWFCGAFMDKGSQDMVDIELAYYVLGFAIGLTPLPSVILQLLDQFFK